MLNAWVNQLWYSQHPLRWGLFPFALLYQFITTLRRYFLRLFKRTTFSVPVIVVGNLTVGGTGKTPLVLAIADALKAKGLTVGIVSRGYRSQVTTFPYEVLPTDSAEFVGDEPLLLAKKSQCPVVIAPKRVEAVQYLLDRYHCQIIISDDGLQHYALDRAMELVVIDGQRGLGNELCLPAGPLRESRKRLNRADFLIVNEGTWPDAFQMQLIPGALSPIQSQREGIELPLAKKVAAVAAIGNPNRFFDTLKTLQISFKAYPFADHHAFTKKDLDLPEPVIIMTEKDAVKCASFATENMYYLPVKAQLEERFWREFWSHEAIQHFSQHKERTGSHKPIA